MILLLLSGKYSELIQAIRKLARKEEDLPFCFQLHLIFFFNAVISRCMCVCVCVCESVCLSRIKRRIHSNGLFLFFSKDAYAHVLAFFPAATVKKKKKGKRWPQAEREKKKRKELV